ncbi:MAG: hypothetical protein IK083_07040 [Abditibacteriota bacterium]|nr:hypothetical protein [Abditibacteriota bacterium]
MTFYPYHENTFWANDAVYTSFDGFKVLSDNGKFNFIVPVNEELDLLTGFSDIDYKMVGNVCEEYYADDLYTFSYSGDPAGRPDYVTTYDDHSPHDILSYEYDDLDSSFFVCPGGLL